MFAWNRSNANKTLPYICYCFILLTKFENKFSIFCYFDAMDKKIKLRLENNDSSLDLTGYPWSRKPFLKKQGLRTTSKGKVNICDILTLYS